MNADMWASLVLLASRRIATDGAEEELERAIQATMEAPLSDDQAETRATAVAFYLANRCAKLRARLEKLQAASN